MRVCLMVEGQENVTWDQWVALARACEEHGLAGLFRSDHYLSVSGRVERGSLDAWATLSGLAAMTGQIRLGALVSPVTFRHPSVLAKTVVTADHVSGGRVELGMGAGWHRGEHRAYGFDFPSDDQRMGLLEEQLEILHRQWHGIPFSFEGPHYRIDQSHTLPGPLQQPHPPLILGGHAGPRSARLAAKWADEYNTIFATPEECAARRARVAQAWEGENRDPSALRFSLMTGVVVGRDDDEVWDRARAVMDRSGKDGDPRTWLARKDAWVTGTVDRVAARLRELADAGVDRVMLQHLVHQDLETVEILGREVVPLVASPRP
jgi:F420-dependent oxidoreductase-like protein